MEAHLQGKRLYVQFEMTIMYSIVIPVYNEQEVLPEFYHRLSRSMEQLDEPYEIIFINDGSQDRSMEILHKLHVADSRVKIIHLSRNFGHQAAITVGMDYASGDAVITMDADLQDPPEVLLQLIQKYREGYDVVYATRKKRKGETFSKRFTARVFYRLIHRLADVNIPVDTGDFRLINRSALNSLNSLREKRRFVRGLVSWIGFRQIGITYQRDPRYAGKTKYPLRKMLKFALDGITSFSDIPLHIAMYLGFATSGFAFLYAVIVVLLKFLSISFPGYTSIMVTILFLGGVQLITIGIIGEYIGRIYDEVKGRPLYIVQELIGFDKPKDEKYDTEGLIPF